MLGKAYLYRLQRLWCLNLNARIYVEVNVVACISHVNIHCVGGTTRNVWIVDRVLGRRWGVEMELEAAAELGSGSPLVVGHVAGRRAPACTLE